jgi:hypothetical protein
MARGNGLRTGYKEVTGQMPDISKWMDFAIYDLIWWLDRPTKPNFTDSTHRLAHWLGVSHHFGSDLSYWLITKSGKIISKTSVKHVLRTTTYKRTKGRKLRNSSVNSKRHLMTLTLSSMAMGSSTAYI